MLWLLAVLTLAQPLNSTSEPVCYYTLSSREMLQVDPRNGDEVISFLALHVKCFNKTGTTKTPLPIFGLTCKDDLIWSSKEQGCGRCPTYRHQLLEADKKRLKELGDSVFMQPCEQEGSDACVCDVKAKTINKNGSPIWKSKRLNNVSLLVKDHCRYDQINVDDHHPRCFEYKSLTAIGLMPHQMHSWVNPELMCPGGRAYTKSNDMLSVYLAPSTENNAAYHMMRFFYQFGFETELEIVKTLNLRSNIARMLFPVSVETGGVASKVGPTLDELDGCKIKMNLFLNKRGHAILNNNPIDSKEIKQVQPLCGADQIDTLTRNYDESLALLTNISQTSVSCEVENDDDDRRRLEAKPGNRFIRRRLEAKPEKRFLRRRLEECNVVLDGDSNAAHFGDQDAECCDAMQVLICSGEGYDGTCRDLGYDFDAPNEGEKGTYITTLCNCQEAMVSGLEAGYKTNDYNKGLYDGVVDDGEFNFCKNAPSTSNNRTAATGASGECKIGPMLYFGVLDEPCCKAITTVSVKEMHKLDVHHIIPDYEEPDSDEEVEAWNRMCVEYPQCSQQVLQGLRKHKGEGGRIRAPGENGDYFQPEVNMEAASHFDPNNTGKIDGCSRLQELTADAACVGKIEESLSTDNEKCLDSLTGRTDGKFLTTCTNDRKLRFSQLTLTCKTWICSTYLQTIFNHCTSSPQLICCGVGGDSAALFEYCPVLRSQYTQLCPEGCKRALDCHTCHASCEDCKVDQDGYVCHLRCDYEECGRGDPKDAWRLYDGMPCHRQREILEEMMGAALQRAFSFSAMDTYSGCKKLLNSWTNTAIQVVQETITGCSVWQHDEMGQFNQAWVEDPCCNHDMLRKQCCAPRTVNVSQYSLTVNEDAIALYAAAANAPPTLALHIAQVYSEAANSASTDCFKPYKQFMNQTENVHLVAEQCWREVNGDDFDRQHGTLCTKDVDCWTGQCIASRTINTESDRTVSQQKYCALPLDTEEKDMAIPLMSCMLARNPVEVIAYFKYLLGLNQSADTTSVAQSMVATFPDITHTECQGREHNFWTKKTKEDCEVAEQCNWNWNAQGNKCLDPCSSIGGLSCTGYCASLTDKTEMSVFPLCRARKDLSVYHHQCWETVRAGIHTKEQQCRECRHTCEQDRRSESCWSECDGNVCADAHDWVTHVNNFELCFDVKCQTIGSDFRAFNQNGDYQCINVAKSFSSNKKADCISDCQAANGPRPTSPPRCVAELNSETAKQGSCHRLAELSGAWVEERYPELRDWDWSKGRPAPKYCWLRGYMLSNDNKPLERGASWEDSEWVSLNNCKTTAECNLAESRCQAFWQRDAGNIQTKIDAAIESWSWATAPWEDSARQCEELGEICFIGVDQAETIADQYTRKECDKWKQGPGTASCLASRCDGCINPSDGECDHCCQCHSNTTIRHAAGVKIHGKGNYWCQFLKRQYEDTLGSDYQNLNDRQLDRKYHDLPISQIYFKDNLLGGDGACVHHINHKVVRREAHGNECKHKPWLPQCTVSIGPADCASADFSFYTMTTEWKEGVLDNSADCEAEVCDPEPWIKSQEKCEKVKYCRGHCWYCDTSNFHDWERSQDKVMCVFKTADGADLTQAQCTQAGAAAPEGETGTTFAENAQTNTSICQTDPPSASEGATEADRCRGSRLLGDGTEFVFTPLACKDFSRDACGWAATQFPTLECSVHPQQCKTKEDCESAGRCEYHGEDHLVEQDGGICISPFDLTIEDFDPHDPNLFRVWEQCTEERNDNLVGRWAHVGCALFNASSTSGRRLEGLQAPKDADQEEYEKDERNRVWKEPIAGMTADSCPSPAKWIPFARSQSECQTPGYIWGDSSGATMSCCVEWGGIEGSEDCWVFSQNTQTEEACSACSGKWMSVFRFRREGSWVEGRWKRAYKWQQRATEKKNVWMQTLAHGKLKQVWDKVVFAVRSGPTANLARCRAGSLLDFMTSIAKRENPAISIGTAELLPGVAQGGTFGGVELTTTTESTTNKTEIQLHKKPASVNDGNQRLRLRRRLADITIGSFSASCWSSVVNSAGLVVGQIIGDCIVFNPDIALNAPVRICLPINAKIAVNPDFDTYDFGDQLDRTQLVLGKTTELGSGGSALCADIQESLTYCPIKRLSTTEGSDVVARSNDCAEMAAIAQLVEQRSAEIKNSADYASLVQSLGFLLEGENAPAEVDDEGSAFGIEGSLNETQGSNSTTTNSASSFHFSAVCFFLLTKFVFF